METTYQPRIKFFQQRSFGDKVNVTFDFLKENFKPLFKILLTIEGPLIVIAAVLNVIQQQKLMEMTSAGANADNPFAMMGAMGITYTLSMAVSVVIMASFPAIVFRYVQLYQTTPPSAIHIKQILSTLFRDSGMLFAVTILFFIAFFIGFMILFIPGIYFMIAFSLAFPIIFFEDINAFEGMSRSMSLIKGSWWSTFGFLIIIYIIQMAIAGLFMAPQMGIYFGQMFATVNPENVFEPMSVGQMLINMVITAIGTLGAYLTYSISAVAISFQYFNLREKKESFGLMQEINTLENPL